MRELEIENCLVEMATILKRYNRKIWANEVSDHTEQWHRAYTQNGNKLRVLKSVQSMYGTMGSLSDTYITHLAGDPILPDDETSVNKEFQELETRLYELVTDEIKCIESQAKSNE